MFDVKNFLKKIVNLTWLLYTLYVKYTRSSHDNQSTEQLDSNSNSTILKNKSTWLDFSIHFVKGVSTPKIRKKFNTYFKVYTYRHFKFCKNCEWVSVYSQLDLTFLCTTSSRNLSKIKKKLIFFILVNVF
jgi:hypothetical protein